MRPFSNTSLILVLAPFFGTVSLSAVAALPIVHSYIGRDSSAWSKTAWSASDTANPGAAVAAVYAGGEYNVSIAKTAVDSAGNVYAIGSQLVTILTSTGSHASRHCSHLH